MSNNPGSQPLKLGSDRQTGEEGQAGRKMASTCLDAVVTWLALHCVVGRAGERTGAVGCWAQSVCASLRSEACPGLCTPVSPRDNAKAPEALSPAATVPCSLEAQLGWRYFKSGCFYKGGASLLALGTHVRPRQMPSISPAGPALPVLGRGPLLGRAQSYCAVGCRVGGASEMAPAQVRQVRWSHGLQAGLQGRQAWLCTTGLQGWGLHFGHATGRRARCLAIQV